MIIYIVNASPALTPCLESALLKLGNEVHAEIVSNNSDLVLLFNEQGKPDLLVIDDTLLTADASDMLRTVFDGDEDCSFPVIVLFDLFNPDVFAAAYRLGIHDVILTSADPERFFNKIRNLVFVHQKIIHLENTIANLNKKMSSMQYEDILGMCRMAEARDGFLGGHLDRVGHYSAKIAKNMGIGDHECMMFNCASKLHDIGKVGIPDHILNKPGKLTQEEFETVKTHSVRGFEIVRGCQQNVLLDQAKEVILYHHESWDGSGYPYGLRGDEIPPLARIVKVVDVFDALMSKRAYKEPWDFDTAVDYLRKNCNVQFEPAIVDIFLGLVSKSDFD